MTMQLTDDTMTVPVTSERPRPQLRSRIGAGRRCGSP